MSEFKYQWQLGDEFRRKPDNINIHGIIGRVIGNGVLQRTDSHQCLWLCLRTNKVSYFHISYPSNIEPRGKKTKARYAAAKAKWESENAQAVIEFRIGDYAASTKENLVFKVRKLQNGWLSDGGCLYNNPMFMRPATPAEIKAHELSLKPSVEQLRIELDAAADALAGYCCGIYPKGENIHLEKFKEAKAAHLQAVGGEG